MCQLLGHANIEIFFVSLPGWFVATVLYIVLSLIYQRKIHQTPAFRTTAQAISWLATAGTVLPCILLFLGKVELAQVKLVMLISAVVWFVATPVWMGMKKTEARNVSLGDRGKGE